MESRELLDDEWDPVRKPDYRGALITREVLSGRDIVDKPHRGRPVETEELEHLDGISPGDDRVVTRRGDAEDPLRPAINQTTQQPER